MYGAKQNKEAQTKPIEDDKMHLRAKVRVLIELWMTTNGNERTKRIDWECHGTVNRLPLNPSWPSIIFVNLTNKGHEIK